MRKSAAFGLAIGLLLGFVGTSAANELWAVEVFGGTIVGFQPRVQYANMTLRVSGPNGFRASVSFPSGSPAMDLTKYGAVYDGIYNYYLTGTTGEIELGSGRNDGRPSTAASPYQLKEASKGGSFRVQGGAIVSRMLTEPKRTR